MWHGAVLAHKPTSLEMLVNVAGTLEVRGSHCTALGSITCPSVAPYESSAVGIHPKESDPVYTWLERITSVEDGRKKY